MWTVVSSAVFVTIMLNDSSPFLNFGPSERTVLFGVKLDTWGEYTETNLHVTSLIPSVCLYDDGVCVFHFRLCVITGVWWAVAIYTFVSTAVAAYASDRSIVNQQ